MLMQSRFPDSALHSDGACGQLAHDCLGPIWSAAKVGTMKRWIVLALLVAGCIPLPYVGGIVTQAAQVAQEQAREEERQAAQQRAAAQARAQEQARAQAEQQARWEAARQAQAEAEAARRQQEALREQEAARIRWQAAAVAAQPQATWPASAAAVSSPETQAAAVAVDQSTASPDDPLASEAQTRTNPAPRLPPLTVAADPPAASPTLADPPDPDLLSDNQPPRRQQKRSQRPSIQPAKRKPAAPAKRYEVIQVLMCNDGTESPTCACGGPRRGCCSHHGGVSGCESRRIPLGSEP